MSTAIKEKHVFIPFRYGITEKKKAELDALSIDILNASHDVEQYQAITSSLTEKSNVFQGFLAIAEGDRAKALSNRNLIDQLIQSTEDLKNNSAIAFNEASIADSKTTELAKQCKVVMDKLIYSAEMINKLANQVIRKKALNPLISDELVSMISTAGNDANNAVALTLVALKSVFTAQASNMESKSATVLEYSQSLALYQLMVGNEELVTTNSKGEKIANDNSLRKLFHDAYENARKHYDQTHEAFVMTMAQLSDAQASLNRASIKLRSLQSGFAAGTAAALAS